MDRDNNLRLVCFIAGFVCASILVSLFIPKPEPKVCLGYGGTKMTAWENKDGNLETTITVIQDDPQEPKTYYIKGTMVHPK